ncbi:hypothetical protein ACFVU3_37425 [Streptomyces sp. NPDC058052]|uniref:hypothetical protein n=1 Tax=Streptomyces sp. NPDC058052 TaxID=3346316 RepID=UPI0036EAACDD
MMIVTASGRRAAADTVWTRDSALEDRRCGGRTAVVTVRARDCVLEGRPLGRSSCSRSLPGGGRAGAACVMIGRMGFIHKFNGRHVYLTLGTGALVISRASGVFAVPLAAIAEVRVAGSDARSMEIVLTDGESHHVEGISPDATTAFITRLVSALPEQRDPAGSALIIRDHAAAPEGVPWVRLTVLALVLLACAGYAVWVGVTHGARVVGVVAGFIVLFLALVTAGVAIEKVALRMYLARHGVTVDAERVGRSGEGPLYYYNDAAGVPRQYSGGSGAPTIPVTYDPVRPHRAAHVSGMVAVVCKTALALIAGALLLVLGVWMSFGLLW